MQLTMFELPLLLGFWSLRPSVFSLSTSTPKRTNKNRLSTRDNKEELEISRRSACLAIGAVVASGGGITLLKSSRRRNKATASRLVDNNNNVFQGTSLPLLSLDAASALSFQTEHDEDISAKVVVFPFAQWPDPLLRRPASRVDIPSSLLANDDKTTQLAAKLQSIARILRKTAHEKEAVGLAAQQCGIDVSMVYLDEHENNSVGSTINSVFQKWWTSGKLLPNEKDASRNSDDTNDGCGGIFLLNPRIINRSREADMLVWTEECLVLPSWFRATVLRDAWVTIEYESIFPQKDDDESSVFVTKQVTLHGELARAAQHEIQHDEGILLLDHVDLMDLPAFMQDHEAHGHNERMQRAFSRSVASCSTLKAAMNVATSSSSSTTPSFLKLKQAIVPKANAAVVDNKNVPPVLRVPANNKQEAASSTSSSCNDACIAERKRIIEQRRAMMRQSRSNTNRQDVFRLSQQRAVLVYNTTYQGAQCQPGVPCI